MIDFKNATFLKMKQVDNSTFAGVITPMLIQGEEIISTYKTIRDGVVFTTKRIIAINVQGITGSKKDFTSLPYSKITAYSVETAGTFDLDSELEMWFSGLGKVKFEFKSNANVTEICRIISTYALQ
ncbi:MAG: PH domain-containing protein [Eubacterium sp.]|nr:PH domain-containing protein [Eubacterium sp.]